MKMRRFPSLERNFVVIWARIFLLLTRWVPRAATRCRRLLYWMCRRRIRRIGRIGIDCGIVRAIVDALLIVLLIVMMTATTKHLHMIGIDLRGMAVMTIPIDPFTRMQTSFD